MKLSVGIPMFCRSFRWSLRSFTGTSSSSFDSFSRECSASAQDIVLGLAAPGLGVDPLKAAEGGELARVLAATPAVADLEHDGGDLLDHGGDELGFYRTLDGEARPELHLGEPEVLEVVRQ